MGKMNPDTDRYKKADKTGGAPEGAPGDAEQIVESKPIKQMKCEDIQPMIFAYLNKELSDAFFVLVREHIRKCQNCNAIANEMKSTMTVLKKADVASPETPVKLSEERRNKILQEVVGGHQYQGLYLVIVIFTVVITVWGGCNMIREIYDWGYEPMNIPEEELPDVRPGMPPLAVPPNGRDSSSNATFTIATTNTSERANP
jgi:hypothetical protein